MKPIFRQSAFLVLLAMANWTAQAADMLVEARVLDVEPVVGSRQVAESSDRCAAAGPAPRNDLVELLRWDLQVACAPVYRTERIVTGYRVRYEWDGRIHTRILQQPPSGTVRLRVSIH